MRVADDLKRMGLLDTLLTRAPVGFVFLDRDLRFVRINEQLAKINGFAVAATLAGPWQRSSRAGGGMNGIDAMQILRADPPTAQTPVIAVSAFAMPAEIDRALEAGFFSYLTKPINLKEFIAALDLAITFSQTKSTAQLQRPNKSRTQQQALRS